MRYEFDWKIRHIIHCYVKTITSLVLYPRINVTNQRACSFLNIAFMKNSPMMLKTPEWKNLAKPKLLDTRLKYFLPWCDQQNILHKAIIEVQLNQQSKKPRHKSIKVASHVWIGNFELHTYIHWHRFFHWN